MTDPSPDVTPAPTEPAQQHWDTVKKALRNSVPAKVFDAWFTRLELDGVDGGLVRLSVPIRFVQRWIESHYLEAITAAWRHQRPDVRVEIVVRNIGVPRASAQTCQAAAPALEAPAPAAETITEREADTETLASELSGRFSFASFVVGPSNRLAHAALSQIAATSPVTVPSFNPLYIHADVGLGKTHLLQATADAAAWAGRGVTYFTAERFMFAFAAAMRNQSLPNFKHVLRSVRLLLVDDLQFLTGKIISAEFGHALNAMLDAERQVVLAGDRPPADLENLDDRIRSRLMGGLVLPIKPMDRDLRLAILTARAQSYAGDRVSVPPEVLEFIAAALGGNGRDLEGCFNRLLVQARMTGTPVTLALAEAVVADYARPATPPRVKIEEIQRVVARHFNVSRSDMLSARRTANVVRPRQLAMYLAKNLTPRSLPEIGRRFGGRDHTTVLHAVRKIEALADRDQAFAAEVAGIKKLLMEAAA